MGGSLTALSDDKVYVPGTVDLGVSQESVHVKSTRQFAVSSTGDLGGRTGYRVVPPELKAQTAYPAGWLVG
jgi:hypothetical protein